MNRHAYPTDQTDEQWTILAPLIPPAPKNCRPRQADMHEVLNGIFHVPRTGCAWRLLPHDPPPYRTVFYYFSKWRERGAPRKIHDNLHERLREQQDRDPSPSAAILDSQSVKTGEKGSLRAAMTRGKRSKGASSISLWTRSA